MNPRTWAAIVLGGCLAVILGLVWADFRAARAARAALDLLAKKRVLLQSGIHRAEEELAAEGHGRAESDVAPMAQIRGETSPAAVTITPGLTQKAVFAALAADPKLSALGMKVFRAKLSLCFGPLYRALNFTPEQVDKFESLAQQHQEAILDIMLTAFAQGSPLSDPAIATLMKQENDQNQAAQRALLGSAGFYQLQQFDRAQPVIGIVNQVAINAALSPTPMTGSQADQLLQILADASSQYQGGGAATVATIDWPAALGQAKGILSPTQFAGLDGIYAGKQIGPLVAQFADREKGVK